METGGKKSRFQLFCTATAANRTRVSTIKGKDNGVLINMSTPTYVLFLVHMGCDFN